MPFDQYHMDCYNYYMQHPTYDSTSTDSILDYAFRLTGKTLRDFLTPEEQLEVIEDKTNKGMLGNLVEKYYFHINPGSSPLPDFPEAGIELKTAAVKPSTGRRKPGPLPITPSAYQSKERVKLARINYMNLVDEQWENNSLFKKCATILLLLSLFDANKDLVDRMFIAEPILWRLSGKDIEFIMNDWNRIVSKVRAGEAHNLSGSDTFYLEACTSGTGKMVKQPFSSEPAKERSFAFKPSFIDASFLRNPKYAKGLTPILSNDQRPDQLEEVVIKRLNRFEGLEVHGIAKLLGTTLSNAKQYLALLSYAMLGIKSNKAEEFVKAGIEIKTVNLNKNGTPREDISFPAFAYMDIIGEDWEDSTFKHKIDTRTLFIIFRTDEKGKVSFRSACFWSMPEQDIAEAERVWQETKKQVLNGHAKDGLPSKEFSKVAHVRPHGRTSRPEHRIPSPRNGYLPVKGFWLNSLYIKRQLEPLID